MPRPPKPASKPSPIGPVTIHVRIKPGIVAECALASSSRCDTPQQALQELASSLASQGLGHATLEVHLPS